MARITQGTVRPRRLTVPAEFDPGMLCYIDTNASGKVFFIASKTFIGGTTRTEVFLTNLANGIQIVVTYRWLHENEVFILDESITLENK